MHIRVAHALQERKKEAHRARHQQPRPRSHGLPRPHRPKPPSPGISPSVSAQSVSLGPNSPEHHTYPLSIPTDGDPGPSTERYRSTTKSSGNDTNPSEFLDSAQEPTVGGGPLPTPGDDVETPVEDLPASPRPPLHEQSTFPAVAGSRPYRVWIKDVSDEEEDETFGRSGYLSDGSDWKSDPSDDEDNDTTWLNGVTEEDTLHDAFQAEASMLGMRSRNFGPLKRHADAEPFLTARELTEDDLDDIEAFNYKVNTNQTDAAFSKLPRGFRRLANLMSVDKLQRRIAFLSGVKPRLYDCCVNSCCCFTRQYEKLSHCPFCHEPRHDRAGKPRNTFSYIPLLPRFKDWFRNPELVDKLRYRADYKTDGPNADCDDIMDIFDGTHYFDLLDRNVTIADTTLPHRFFSEDDDIALGLSFDGFCPFKLRKQTCWPIIAFNYNLPPEERFHIDNVICLGVIPGPKQAKDTDSFLWPFVEEMLRLAEGEVVFNARTGKSICLHAYIIAAFGDIPAVAKLMRMKGHNGKSPCRMCSIAAMRPPNQTKGTTHYTPLWRPDNRSYDPLNLPLRTHSQFLQQASQVDSAPTEQLAKELATSYGIKGTPLLSLLSSLEFPISFPYDFMHLVWENVVKTLADLWGGDAFKGMGEGSEKYRLGKTIWSAIGEGCKRSGDTIPSAFGCRVPSIATERSHFIAELWAQWTLYVGPVLLRKVFCRPKYQQHFVKLVSLLKQCMQFSLSFEDVAKLRTGFAEWVTEYERHVNVHMRCSMYAPRS